MAAILIHTAKMALCKRGLFLTCAPLQLLLMEVEREQSANAVVISSTFGCHALRCELRGMSSQLFSPSMLVT